MSAEVIDFPRRCWPPEPPSRLERAQGTLSVARGRLRLLAAERTPIVIMRRDELARREINAFKLGRECARYMSR